MKTSLNRISIKNFKSFGEKQNIEIADLSVFLGANSSGKSTALQTLLMLKQTIECNSPNINLLLSGKYVTLGDYKDVLNDKNNECVEISLSFCSKSEISNESEIVYSFLGCDEENQNGSILNSLSFKDSSIKLEFKYIDNYQYELYVDDKITPFMAEIHNLKITFIYAKYSKRFNELFYNFLSDFLNTVLGNKSKSPKITKSEMVSYVGLRDFFMLLSDKIDSRKKNDSNAEIITAKFDELIKKYEKVQFKYDDKFSNVPDFIRNNILESVIRVFLRDNSEKLLNELYNKYDAILCEYKEDKEDKEDYCIQELGNPLIYLNLNDNNESSDYDQIRTAIKSYSHLIKGIFDNIFYVGPIREKPLGLYNIGFEAIPKYVGTTGAFFASVLLHENIEKNYILPDNEKEKTSLLEALDVWALHLNIANKIDVNQNNSFGINVSIENTQNKEADIMNVGIGTSQVLPVLITGLLSEENETLIFEQPELHLHPYSQSRLADFFVELIKNRRRIIIETHSEYFVLRLRYHILSGDIDKSYVTLNYFHNKNGTIVEKANIDSYGNLEYPTDFKDETQRLLDDLMRAALKKGK